MKTLLLAGACALALGLGGCANLSPFAVNAKADPAAQAIQAEAKAAIDKSIINRLDHCTLTGQWSVGAGGLAGTSTGASFGGGVQCPARPWDGQPPAEPAKQ